MPEKSIPKKKKGLPKEDPTYIAKINCYYSDGEHKHRFFEAGDKLPEGWKHDANKCTHFKLENKAKQSPDRYGMKAYFANDKNEIFIERASRIPDKLGIDLSPELLKKFKGILECYLFDKNNLKNLPSLPAIKKLMNDLSVSAETFIKSIKDVQHTVIKRPLQLPYEIQSNKAIKELCNTVDMWRKAAKTYPLHKGGSQDPFLDNLIRNVAHIYQEATGQKPSAGYYDSYSNSIVGEFSQLIDQVLLKLDKPYWSAEALIKRVKKALI